MVLPSRVDVEIPMDAATESPSARVVLSFADEVGKPPAQGTLPVYKHPV